MSIVFNLAWGKLVRMLREPWVVLLMTALPLVFTYFLGQAGSDSGKKIPVAMVDLDQSLISSRLAAELKSNPAYRVTLADREKALSLVKENRALAAFIIPAGFSGRLAAGGEPSLEVYRVGETGEIYAAQNALRTALGRVVSGDRIAGLVVSEISQEKDIGGREGLVREKAYKNARAGWFPDPPVNVESRDFSGARVNSYDQMTHASIGFALFFVMYTAVFGVGEILTEKKNGTWQRILTMPPARWQVLAGNLLGACVVTAFQLAVLLLAGKYLFGVNWGDNLLPALVVSAAFIFCITSLGLLLSGIIKTDKQLQAVTPVLLVSTSMLGGCFWPLDIVQSKILLTLSKIVPQTWAMASLEGIVTRGLAMDAVLAPVGILAAMGLIYFAAGLYTLKWES